MSEESGNRQARAETEEVARKSRQKDKALEDRSRNTGHEHGVSRPSTTRDTFNMAGSKGKGLPTGFRGGNHWAV